MARGRLTPKIRELVATDRNARPPIGRLTADQIEILSVVARRQGEFDVSVSAPRAIATLATGARPDVATRILDRVLSDRQAPRADRVSAARGLGHIASPEAERGLLRYAHDRDPRVQQDVLAALGAFAGPSAARRLGAVPEPDDPAARRQLAFARALIAHRHTLNGPFLPDVPGVERRAGRSEQMTNVRMGAKTAKTTAADLERLRGSTYGIKFNERAFSLRCGTTDWTIFVNDKLGAPVTSLTHLFDRPWITAVFAEWFRGRQALMTRHVLLSRPVGEVVKLDVVRGDGSILYTGTARRAGASTAFAISDVDRPGIAPTTIAGRITSRGVTLDEVVAFARLLTRETAPVDAD